MKKEITAFLTASLSLGLFLAGSASAEAAVHTPKPATLAESIIYTENDLVITALSLSEDSYGDITLETRLENTSDRDLSVELVNACVNDHVMVYSGFDAAFDSVDLAAGETAESSILLYDVYMEPIDFDVISSIDLWFKVYDAAEYAEDKHAAKPLSASGTITLVPQDSETFSTDSPAPGKLLCETDGFLVFTTGLTPASYSDASVMLYIENKSEEDCSLICDAITINGKTADPAKNVIFWVNLPAGKRVMDSLDLMDLESLGIFDFNEIKELSFSLTGYQPDSYEILTDMEGLVAIP